MRERFYLDAFAEYRKRLQGYCRLELCEIGEQRLPDAPSEKEIAAALEKEAEEILKAIPPDAYVVALCVEGRQMPSEGMAELIRERENSGKPKLCFVIGGSYGLAPSRQGPGRPAAEHVRDDLPAPSGPGDADRADLPRLQDQRGRALSQVIG